MPRYIGKLTELQVRRFGPGLHSDGGGLYLRVEGNHRGWVFRYGAQGRRYNSIGPAHAVSLQEARDQARLCRKLLLDGIDPIAAKRARVAAAKAATATTQTFEQCAEACFDSHKQVWKNAKHRREWLASLAKFVHPAIGALPVAAIDTAMVLRVLGPIWTTLPETATRVRSRVEKVLDWARARGYRSGDNPARWKGHLDHLLPAQPRAKRVVHHAALRYSDIPVFTQKLRQRNGSDARALEFIVLTAARSAEATNADWNEFDLANGIWTVPSGRMKAGKAHRVPLSSCALALLERTPPDCREGYVFSGSHRGRPVGGTTVWRLARELAGVDITVHGFRSSFRDWAAETTGYPNHVVEMALAHAVADQTEEAYRRGDLFEKRRRLMDEWSAFCAAIPRTGAVLPLRRG
jgi:integrase